MGALVWFLIVLIINTRLEKTSLNKYIDGLTISLLFVFILWYIGAFLWGQVYGRETTFGIEMLYTHAFTPVPYEVPVFPLAIIYSILSFILFSGLYILSMFTHIKGFIWYLGIIMFSCILLIFEFFSGKFDIFKLAIGINMTQLCALVFIVISAIELYKILKVTTVDIIQKDNIPSDS